METFEIDSVVYETRSELEEDRCKGYYSEGYLADLYDAPEYNQQKNAIILGHSHQSY